MSIRARARADRRRGALRGLRPLSRIARRRGRTRCAGSSACSRRALERGRRLRALVDADRVPGRAGAAGAARRHGALPPGRSARTVERADDAGGGRSGRRVARRRRPSVDVLGRRRRARGRLRRVRAPTAATRERGRRSPSRRARDRAHPRRATAAWSAASCASGGRSRARSADRAEPRRGRSPVLVRVRLRIENLSPVRRAGRRARRRRCGRSSSARTRCSRCRAAQFVSLLDPPAVGDARRPRRARTCARGRCSSARRASATSCCRRRSSCRTIRRSRPRARAISSTRPRSTRS